VEITPNFGKERGTLNFHARRKCRDYKRRYASMILNKLAK